MINERRLSLRDEAEPVPSVWQAIGDHFGAFGVIWAFVFGSIGVVSAALALIFALAKYA
jgi:hypothetical protein